MALAVWLGLRTATAVVTALVAHEQPENLWTRAGPGYLEFVGIWDGRWYAEIAEQGYPRPLPVDPDGRPAQSAWAFFPAYPALVRLVMEVTGLGWTVTAPTVSLLLGCGLAVVGYRLFRLRASRQVALGAVAVLAVFPSAAVLQYAYADVLTLLSVAGALYLLTTRHYLWCLLPVAALGLSRPVGLPFVAVVLVHGAVRVHRRRSEELGAGERVALVVLAVTAVGAPLAFGVAVAVAAGRPDGYLAVQDAWRAGDGVRLFTPWWSVARLLVGERAAAVALVVLPLATAAVLAARRVRALGPEMWTWCAAYALFLAAVVEPYTSMVRHLLLFAPLALAVSGGLLERAGAAPRRQRVALAAVLLASFALQALWVDELWHFDPPTDPPP